MNKKILIRVGIMLLVLVYGYFNKDKFAKGDSNGSGAAQPQQVESQPAAKPLELKEDPLGTEKSSSPPAVADKPAPAPIKEAEKPASKLVMKGMQIRDMDGSIAYRGDVDLAPTLARIEAGRSDSHRNDGSTFGNREGLLPRKDRGYYKEYVVRTPNIRHAGPQRLVIGRGGEVYYTHDHYKSFKRVQ